MELKINFQVLKDSRAKKDISIRRLAKLSGVNRSTISNYEEGRSAPDAINLLKLMIFFGLSPNDVVEK